MSEKNTTILKGFLLFILSCLLIAALPVWVILAPVIALAMCLGDLLGSVKKEIEQAEKRFVELPEGNIWKLQGKEYVAVDGRKLSIERVCAVIHLMDGLRFLDRLEDKDQLCELVFEVQELFFQKEVKMGAVIISLVERFGPLPFQTKENNNE